MKIAILGAGNVGGNLGKRLAANGHEVVFGVRDPNSSKTQAALSAIGPTAKALNIAEATAFAEVVALTVPWLAVEETLNSAGDFSGKILIDCTNRMVAPAPGAAPSAAEDIARLAPTARVVKAFNTIGAEHLLNPTLNSQTISMFICGDDETAKTIVGKLVEEVGFELVDTGPLSSAAMVESLAKLWITISRRGHRDIAFKLLQG